MSSVLKNIIRAILFLIIQVYVFGKMPLLHQFVTPYIYFLFILWLPFSINRWALLILGFSYGMVLDYFLGYPGIHAAPCTLIAYLRPFLLTLFIAKGTTEQTYNDPGIKSMGAAPYAFYVILLTFIHHFYLVLIEWLQFGTFVYFITKVLATTACSLLLFFIAEILVSRNAKARSNVE